jgi:outer membrane beta-barrel protein
VNRLVPVSIVALSILGAVFAAPGVASAQQSDAQRYAASAVQERRYFRTHRVTVYGGVLPLDAFEKGITLGGSYALHVDELFAWEVVNFQYSFPVATDLRSQLEGFDLMPTPFEIVEWVATTNLVLTPIYWKAAVGNDSLLRGEFYFLVGGGVGRLTRSTRAAVDVGLGSRFYFDQTFSMVVDLRYLLLFNDQLFDSGQLQDELYIGLGLTVGF